jgi:hypothetical protein
VAKPKEIENIGKDYLSCFSTASGQRVLEDMKKCYGDRGSFDENPYHTAYNEGQRSVYLSILFLIEETKNPKKRQEEGEDD